MTNKELYELTKYLFESWDRGADYDNYHMDCQFVLEALAEQPAQRTWVGLIHDEYDAICDKHSAMSDFDFLADIEAKLKEKNT